MQIVRRGECAKKGGEAQEALRLLLRVLFFDILCFYFCCGFCFSYAVRSRYNLSPPEGRELDGLDVWLCVSQFLPEQEEPLLLDDEEDLRKIQFCLLFSFFVAFLVFVFF